MAHVNLQAVTKGLFPLTIILLTGSILVGNYTYAETGEIEETIVTATRSEKLLNELVVGTVVITRAEIESSGATDLAELLRYHAGLEIGRNGGPGQTTSLFIRGTESNHTLVLIDGVEMNPGTIGGAAIQNISPEIIERIEIVKGPRSSLYGSEAIGGVINVITRKAKKTGLETRLTYGTYDTKKITAHSAFREDERFASFTLDWNNVDGFPSLRNQTEDRGYDNLSVNMRAGLSVQGHSIEFTHWQASGNTEYFGFDTAAFDTGALDQDYSNRVTSLSVSSNFSEQWQSKLLLGHANDNIKQNQFDFFFFPEPKKDRVDTSRFSMDWQNNFSLGQQVFIAGAYFEREDTESLSFGSEYSDPAESKAVYIGSEADLGDFDSLFSARYTEHDSAGSQFSWNVDLGYNFSPSLRAGLTAGAAFRAPDATDRYGFGGNPDLKTEESDSVSAVLNWQSRIGKIGLEAFQTKIDNMIESLIVDPDNFIFQNVNIAESKTRGLEVSHKIKINGLAIDTTALLQSPKNNINNNVLLRRARRSLSVHAHKEFDRIQLGLQLLARSKRADIDAVSFSPVNASGYVLASLNGIYKMNDNASILANIDNLLDTDYETAAGYQQAGRNFKVSLQLKY